jgi:hypothetical protein
MDLNKIKERLETLNKQTRPSGSKLIWKPQPGSQVIRIVPYSHNRDWPFLELLFYYDFGKRTVISPQIFGKPDPVQELVDKLKSTGEREDWMLARKLEPRMRTYVPILVRGQEEEGVKFWGFGKTVYEELLKTIDDPDYGDITDLKNGTDITVEYDKPKDGYPNTSFRVKRTSTPATKDPAVIEMLKDMPTIDEIWEVPTYEALSDMLEAFINNTPEQPQEEVVENNTTDVDYDFDIPAVNSDDDDAFDALLDSKPTAKGVSTKSMEPKSTPKVSSTIDDIDSAFDSMFN